ncbi:MAG: hypothetical protein U0869_25495 [Chloroflexota bacterium]
MTLTTSDLAVLLELAERYLAEPAPHGRVSVSLEALARWIAPQATTAHAWDGLLRLLASGVREHDSAMGWTGEWKPITEVFLVGSVVHVKLHERLTSRMDGRHPEQALDVLIAQLATQHDIEVPA